MCSGWSRIVESLNSKSVNLSSFSPSNSVVLLKLMCYWMGSFYIESNS